MIETRNSQTPQPRAEKCPNCGEMTFRFQSNGRTEWYACDSCGHGNDR